MSQTKLYKIIIVLCLVGIAISLTFVFMSNKSDINNEIKKEKNIEYTFEDKDSNTISTNETKESVESQLYRYKDVQLSNNNIVVLEENAEIIYKTKYISCGHETSVKDVIPSDMVGLTRSELEKEYPIYEINTFEPKKVELVYIVDDYCPEHYLVKEYKGKIGVFYISKTVDNPIKQIIDVDVSILRRNDQEKLKEGIRINTDKELAQLIEDYTS